MKSIFVSMASDRVPNLMIFKVQKTLKFGYRIEGLQFRVLGFRD